MFQEQLAAYTSNHLRSHLEGYLSEIAAQFSGQDILGLKIPQVDSATLVGGVMTAAPDRLPLISVDCVEKTFIPSNESLWYYQYDGAIAGLVSGNDAEAVDKLVKRYSAAVEKFIVNHQFLVDHSTGEPHSTPGYTVRELIYGGTNLSGAMEVVFEDPEERIWIDGFTIVTSWITSEDQPRQHT